MATSADDFVALDPVFSLPENIEDSELRLMYETLIARMRREAEGLEMNTVQQLLIERIAYNYIVLRRNERDNSFAHTTAQKDFNSFWLSMTQEFYRMLRGSDVDFRKALESKVVAAITEALNEETPEVANKINARLAVAFTELNM